MKMRVIIGFTIGGAIVGLAFGGGIMTLGLTQAPGMPGILELLVMSALTVGAFAVPAAVVGLLLGCLVSLIVRKR